MDIYQIVSEFYESVTTKKRIIGKSVFGRNLYAFQVGSGSPVGIAQYAIHGREFITARLALKQYSVGVKKGSMWFIPLINPDGCLLSEKGLESVPKKRDRERLLQWNDGEDFSLWKANGRGVDLNVNFDADWGKGVKNVHTAGAENYIGRRPFSEPESRALRRFTQSIRPDYTVSYHTKGEEIYWYFSQSLRVCGRDKALAVALSTSTGYPLCYAKGSVGGYKDWCIQTLKIPAFTIEAGADYFTHPLCESGLCNIWERNRYALYDLSVAYGRERNGL
ncbi:MAG: hypothetical protein IJV85_05800 [Clostridia bacterium]|nr:hypothetical protein [Clostridia bacterium]